MQYGEDFPVETIPYAARTTCPDPENSRQAYKACNILRLPDTTSLAVTLCRYPPHTPPASAGRQPPRERRSRIVQTEPLHGAPRRQTPRVPSGGTSRPHPYSLPAPSLPPVNRPCEVAEAVSRPYRVPPIVIQ